MLAVSVASRSCDESLSDSVSTRKLQVTVKVTTQLRLHVACKLACVKGQSSLHCNCGTVCHGARVKKDSMRFWAISLWMTVSQAGRRFFHPLFRMIFRGGHSPLHPAFRGAAAPRAPPLLTPVPHYSQPKPSQGR